MFCFCFQSPSLKLQALEADLSSPDSEHEELRDLKNLSGPQQPLLSRQSSLHLDHKPLFHSPPTTPAQDTADSSQHMPSPSSCIPAPSTTSPPEGAPGNDKPSPSSPSRPPLLSTFTTSECPVPSPRCPNLSSSLRYNLDPDTAPSPPCSQHIRMARCSIRAEPDDCSLSVSVLKRHVQTLRKRIRQLEEHFEQERLKPSYYDKTAHPEVARLIKELLKSRKQLKELKLCHAEEGVLKGSLDPPLERAIASEGALPVLELQQANNYSNTKPSVEETLHIITKRLSERRLELSMPDSIKEMTQSQIRMEKSSLQKCLLYFESLHGRPGSVSERSLVQPFYERYRILKQLLLSSNASTLITTIEEEESSDDDHPNQQIPKQQCVSTGAPLPPPTLEISDTPPVSPLEEVKCVQPPIVTMATLHEASRSELLDHLRITRLEKRRLHRALREFEDLFYTLSGRVCQKEDRGPMAEEYCQYKNLKAKLRLLEALLSKKQDTAKSN
ncbi:protein FAM13C [Corythoichthys intestinalis]|uniref:protein FAM13C n=1 Tax=Corythoichthys intestinalis TaxID=161448 RepID=UPI0025A6567D|nr:protein FAM13C [Corythoichthys intestinalis]XP_057703620.1 protein FAM13C [Corythoichthys intestinalis]